MIIQEIISKVNSERYIPGRFPSRVIFAHDFNDYKFVEEELRSICDITIDLAEFTNGDLLPDFRELKSQIRKHVDKQILLLSIGEYLRICIKRERNKETSEIPGLWETIQSEHSITKYIIPLFGVRELFDQVVPSIDERQKDFVWEIASGNFEPDYKVTIYAPSFADAVQADASNLHDWLENWSMFFGDKKRNKFSLTSKLFRYSEMTNGRVSVDVVEEPFAYVSSFVTDSDRLKAEFGDDEFWSEVAKEVRQGKPFSETIKYMLNIGRSFDPISILARFDQSTSTEHRLLWIWYQLYPGDDYYTYALRNAVSPAHIPRLIRDAIFTLPRISDKHIVERASALRVLDLTYDDSYFAKLDNTTSPETRLSLLTFKTIEERSYAIKTVSGLLRTGADVNTTALMIRPGYPELSEYLSQDGDDPVSQYFNWYRKSKLINRPATDIPCVIDFDDIDSRNKVLQQSGEAHRFWIDGLGVEWAPLLISKLENLSIPVDVIGKVTKAILPTETEFNRKWSSSDDKWDRLDKLNHSGMLDDKDYYRCVSRQIEIIGEIVAHVSALLERHNRVVITGDHGSSRLAALMFHVSDYYALEPPPNAKVRSFGRFCELADCSNVPLTSSFEQTSLDGKDFVVMRTYEHFKQSGNAAGGNTDDNSVAGEVHGGMTPEEYLVPVITVSRRSSLPIPTKFEPKAATVNELGI